MLNTQTYYIGENEDVLQYFAEKGLAFPAGILKELRFISRKTNNNYIGYYQLLHQGIYHKFFVIPKIYEKLPDGEKETRFMAFLGRFYELKNKYKEVKARDIDGNIVDLSFENFKEKGSKTTQDFIAQKYIYAIKILQIFFRKHNRSRQRKQSYVSQSVKYRLNLINNIRSLDKSQVHQIRKEAEAYSRLAFIAEYALRQFKQEKLPQFDGEIADLRQNLNSTLNIIRKKYKTDPSFKFKATDIITNKIAKLFKKSSELKKVYEAILILLGLEHFQSNEESRDLRKIDNMLALFFNPADLFEWVVYDGLVKKYDENAEILSDKKGQTKIQYLLHSNEKEYPRFSHPDFIVLEDDFIWVIDAKWKILKTPTEIQFSDIAKLKRDCMLREEDGCKVSMAVLIYPKVDFDKGEENPFRIDYDLDFSFYVEEEKV